MIKLIILTVWIKGQPPFEVSTKASGINWLKKPQQGIGCLVQHDDNGDDVMLVLETCEEIRRLMAGSKPLTKKEKEGAWANQK